MMPTANTFAQCKVEISTNGTTWTDISGYATSVALSGGDRQTGEAYPFNQDVAVITTGKREPLEITIKVIYTEGSNEAFETVRQAYEAGSSIYVRWAPLGGQTGEFMFTSDAGFVTQMVYPAGEAKSGDPIMVEIKVKTPKVTKSVAV